MTLEYYPFGLQHKGYYNAVSSNGNALVGGDHIFLSPGEINKHINGAIGVDNRTMGFGMTFLHETNHSNVAEDGPKADFSGSSNLGVSRGPVVNRMNIVRRQLNAQGMNFGVRSTYDARSYNVRGITTNTLLFQGEFRYLHPRPLTNGMFLGPQIRF